MMRARASAAPILHVQGLGVTRQGKTLLRDASLTLAKPSLVAVIGANGAGKSTLIRAITGEWPATGHVALWGQDRRHWQRKALARRMAVMSQHTALNFDLTALDVVELGRLPHADTNTTRRQIAFDALAALGAEAHAQRHVTSLSGGEQQKVHFARALAQLQDAEAPSLLILDEPTAALDLAQQRVVLDAAAAFRQRGNLVLAVLHDLNLVTRYADAVVVMKAGRVLIHADTPAALTPEILTEAYGVAVTVHIGPDGRRVVQLA